MQMIPTKDNATDTKLTQIWIQKNVQQKVSSQKNKEFKKQKTRFNSRFFVDFIFLILF